MLKKALLNCLKINMVGQLLPKFLSHQRNYRYTLRLLKHNFWKIWNFKWWFIKQFYKVTINNERALVNANLYANINIIVVDVQKV